jgi:Ca2+-binding EF-hand superfamily protein
MNTDGDDYIDKDELTSFLKKTQPQITAEEIAGMIRDADSDMDGRVSFDEFCAITKSASGGLWHHVIGRGGRGIFAAYESLSALEDQHVRQFFNTELDVDGDGLVSVEELRASFAARGIVVTHEKLTAMIAQAETAMVRAQRVNE